MKLGESFLWVESHRPKTIEECILPEHLKKMFKGMLEKGEVANMTLAGSPGTGKTTVAKAICHELGYEMMFINGSLERNIDTLRNEITNFASTLSFSGARKAVLIDEADNLTTITQKGLRSFIESVSTNCSFILTCNYPQNIEPALLSRCPIVELKVPEKERNVLIMSFIKRVLTILSKEDVQFDKEAVAKYVMKEWPDNRKILGNLQNYARSAGSIDIGVLGAFGEADVHELVNLLKQKEYRGICEWVAKSASEPSHLYEKLVKQFPKIMEPQFEVVAIVTTAKYMDMDTRSANKSINFLAYLVELMSDCEFK